MTIAYVGGTLARNGGGDSNGFTSSAFDTTGANFILVSYSSGATSLETLTDSKGNTWTAMTASTASGRQHRFYYAFNATVGTGHTFTITGTATYPSLAITWYSGVQSASDPLDQQARNGQVAPSVTAGPITPTVDGCLIATGFHHADGVNTRTLTGGCTMVLDETSTTFGSDNGSYGHLVSQTTAAAISANWSTTNTVLTESTIASFKPASGAPPPANPERELGLMMGSPRSHIGAAPIGASDDVIPAATPEQGFVMGDYNTHIGSSYMGGQSWANPPEFGFVMGSPLSHMGAATLGSTDIADPTAALRRWSLVTWQTQNLPISPGTGFDTQAERMWETGMLPAPPITILTAVGKQLDYRWSVRALAGDQDDFRWSVRTVLGDQEDYRWSTRIFVGDQEDLRWQVKKAQGDQLDTRWSLVTWQTHSLPIAPNLPINSKGDRMWETMQLPSYFVGTTVIGKQVDYRWSIRAILGDQEDLRWQTKQITFDLNEIRWGVRTAFNDSMDVRWGIRTTLGDQEDYRWSVRTKLGDQEDFRWQVKAPVGDTNDIRWNVRAIMPDFNDIRWSVRVRVNDSSDQRWAVRTFVGDQEDLRWAIRTFVGDQEDFRWSVRSRIGDNNDLRWAVKSALGV